MVVEEHQRFDPRVGIEVFFGHLHVGAKGVGYDIKDLEEEEEEEEKEEEEEEDDEDEMMLEEDKCPSYTNHIAHLPIDHVALLAILITVFIDSFHTQKLLYCWEYGSYVSACVTRVMVRVMGEQDKTRREEVSTWMERVRVGRSTP